MGELWRGKIESISQHGLGVAIMQVRVGGKKQKRPLFVPFTTPGDEIEAEIV